MIIKNVFFVGPLLLVLTPAWAESRRLLSNETVPVEVKKNKIQCSDAIPDRGFGAVPAALSVSESNLFDRTLRIEGVGSLWVSLPDTVTCAQLIDQLDRVPESLTASRKLYRIITTNRDGRRTHSRLTAKISLELPVEISGKLAVLHGTQDWVEGDRVTTTSEPIRFPMNIAYTVISHPQSATEYVGLFCKPSYQGASEHQLTLGELSGYDGVSMGRSNVDLGAKTFSDGPICEDVRSDLINRYQAEDPGNWGTPVRVARKLESIYRYILDNQARPTCQEIELDSVTTIVEEMKFVGIKRFPIRTVVLSKCDLPR